MGKKQKEGDDAAPKNANGVQNRDIMQRMNFLWQTSVYLEGIGVGRGRCEGDGKGRLRREVKVEEEGEGEKEDVEMDEGEGAVAERGDVNKEEKKYGKRRKRVGVCDLARVHVQTMKSIGRKTTVKMDPGVKRTMCERCSIVLVPGVSLRVRIRPSKDHGHWMVYTCLKCGTSRRIPAPAHGTNVDSRVDIKNALGNADSSSMDDNVVDMGSKSGVKEEAGESEDSKGVYKGCKKDGGSRGRRRRREKGVGARVPPLFARRSAGHVVFRGGEEVDVEGVCGV